jgi:hypothetical protein
MVSYKRHWFNLWLSCKDKIKLYTGTEYAVPGIFCFLNWETWVAFAVMKLNFNYITEQFTMIFFQLVLFSYQVCLCQQELHLKCQSTFYRLKCNTTFTFLSDRILTLAIFTFTSVRSHSIDTLPSNTQTWNSFTFIYICNTKYQIK